MNQSPDSVASGYNAVNSSGFLTFNLTFDPTSAVREYRIDWLPTRIDMYADDAWLQSFSTSVPSSPGALHLIHWSNGDPGWSGGPPQEDAVLTVSYVRAYFNTSASNTLACAGAASAADTCEITATGTCTSGAGSPTASGRAAASHTSHSSATRAACYSPCWLSNRTTLLIWLWGARLLL